ncbi:hypothetical protein DAPPUDRAFT_240692 [Daphnia pulex]|uniref:G-protein coupled receptors family 1 profile domain-containing protein n=1 Tax=Daphnia pulex TaxID=6669 RepID=E9GC96_DAPPU|nr:hypothetical protein DAPPUDRAFT_240692 [Daphnia pulex]|eukprot:EFX82898.1 hypothetical protein DAPPUDRAFT_240692 [Daphnia pulex]
MGESSAEASSGVNPTQSKFDFSVMDQKLTQATELFRTSVIGIGMILNFLVLRVVSLSRQLRYPRHIYWAAVSIFECFILFEYSLELIVIINRNHLACTFLVLICSVDYSLLLLCLSLTALDRYLSIVRYEWYLANVTGRGVVFVMAIASALTLAIIEIPFWTGKAMWQHWIDWNIGHRQFAKPKKEYGRKMSFMSSLFLIMHACTMLAVLHKAAGHRLPSVYLLDAFELPSVGIAINHKGISYNLMAASSSQMQTIPMTCNNQDESVAS